MRIVIALPYASVLAFLYLLLGVLATPFLSIALTPVFTSAGLSVITGYVLSFSMVLLSLALSPFNLVVREVEKLVEVPSIGYVYIFGVPVPIPRPALRRDVMYVAVNLGGAVIPIALSSVILLSIAVRLNPISYLAALGLSSIGINLTSRVIPGVGVVTPMFMPPLIAVLSTLAFFDGSVVAPAVAYTVGTLGSLIGADLMNLRRILRAPARLVSIGGAGVFDGIYLSGITAGLLALILASL